MCSESVTLPLTTTTIKQTINICSFRSLQAHAQALQSRPRSIEAFADSSYEHHISHLRAQMLIHARILEMNIACCKMLQAKMLQAKMLQAKMLQAKMLQAKILDAEELARFETRIALCMTMLEAMEKVRSI